MRISNTHHSLPIAWSRKALLGGLVLISFVSITIGTFIIHQADARVSGWDAGNIIDDSVFTNATTMSPSQIQSFLNSKVPTCDTNGVKPSEYGGGTRAQWATAKYGQSTFTCLKDFKENGKSSAQIIYDIAQQYQINPQVLLVLLQKEQGLVLDEWPVNIQYRSATGYGCPDSTPGVCDDSYYGFTNQVTWAAKMFRAILNNSPTWYTPYLLGENFIRYSPDSSCGGSNVTILNRATQALYNYTPYQPNEAALNADWGSVSCGAYGNRNFYLYFTSWFGNTHGPAYAWQEISQKLYTSDSKTTELDRSKVQQGQNIYIEYTVKNTGYKIWPRGSVLLGSNSDSPFCTPEWIACSRATVVNKSADVNPGDTASFGFWMQAPQFPGFYKVYWNLLIENVSWFADIGSNHSMTVVPKLTTDHLDSSTDFMRSDDVLTSSDGNANLVLFRNGLLAIYYKGTKVHTIATNVYQLRQQGDGNLVAYAKNGQALWAIGDGKTRQLVIKDDGKLTYQENQNDPGMTIATWNISSGDRGVAIASDQILLQGQSIYSDNRKYKLILQGDGNLVQYGPQGAMWAVGQNKGYRLIQQGDGKLVLYDVNAKAIWGSSVWVNDGRASKTIIQGDGNIVTYNNSQVLWALH